MAVSPAFLLTLAATPHGYLKNGFLLSPCCAGADPSASCCVLSGETDRVSFVSREYETGGKLRTRGQLGHLRVICGTVVIGFLVSKELLYRFAHG